MITQAPRGVEDWYGERMHKRAWVEKQARELARTYNMTEIITPIFEHTVLFQRGVGETTDVVQKEMYTFEDKGGRSITLKPEGTAGAMRAYLERNMYANPAPTKLYYVTQAFRYEKPQSRPLPGRVLSAGYGDGICQPGGCFRSAGGCASAGI